MGLRLRWKLRLGDRYSDLHNQYGFVSAKGEAAAWNAEDAEEHAPSQATAGEIQKAESRGSKARADRKRINGDEQAAA